MAFSSPTSETLSHVNCGKDNLTHMMEVGDGIRVVVAVGKQEIQIYFERWRRRWRKPVNVVTLFKKRIPGCRSVHGMHAVKVEAHRRYASISPKAELKVPVLLNVGHQQGCKVVTSGTSVKINFFFFQRLYDLYSFIAAWPN